MARNRERFLEWQREYVDKNRKKINDYQRVKQREYAAKRRAEKIAMQAEIQLLRSLLEKQLQLKGE